MRIRSLIALTLVVALAVAPVAGCATPAVIHRWNPSGDVTVELFAGSLAMPTPSFRWRMSSPVGDQEGDSSNGELVHHAAYASDGIVELTPSLEGCETVELYSMNGIGPVEPVWAKAGVTYVQTGDVSRDVAQQIWETIEDPRCAVLLTAGIDPGNQAVIRVSTQAGRLKTVALGPTKRNGWIAALPFSVMIDAAGSFFFLILLALSDDDC